MGGLSNSGVNVTCGYGYGVVLSVSVKWALPGVLWEVRGLSLLGDMV